MAAETDDSSLNLKGILILAVLLIAGAVFGMRACQRVSRANTTVDYNTVILHCADCGVNTEYPSTNISMPVCKKCGRTYGSMPNATLERVQRSTPAAGGNRAS